MIALLLGVAAAQSAANCGDGGFPPIAGTSGLANTRAALTTQQQSYSAAAFAERQMFQKIAAGDADELEDGGGIFAWELNTTFGAADVPVYVDNAVHSPQDCPADLRVALAPVDLQAMNLGFGYRKGLVGAFYSASVTYGMVAHPSPYVRGMVWGFGLPMYTTPLLLLAPVTGSWMQTSGASAFAMDYIAGAYVTHPKVGQLSAGYAGSSRGFYVHGNEELLGLHLSTVLKAEARPVSVLKGGLDRLNPAQFAEDLRPIGLTTAFYRDLPFGGGLVASELGGGAGGGGAAGGGQAGGDAPADRFRSAHVDQENLFGVVDLRFAYALAPRPLVNELAVGVHTPAFVLPRNAVLDDLEGATAGARLVGGFTEIPADPTIGAVPGRVATGRIDAVGRFEVDSGGAVVANFKLMLNDPEQLVLYPFSRNALTYSLSIGGTL